MARPFRHVDLCSGIGGFALGFQWAGLSEPVLFCDIEAWSRQVLAKHWPDVPIAEDVKDLAKDARRLVPDCDILSCGYPCQPFSQAGVRRGEEDDRHIWPEIFTIVQAKRPTWCVFENVSGHISLGLDQVLSDLESKDYAVQPFVVPACAVDAPHRRDRVWIVANSDDAGQPASPGPGQDNRNQPGDNTRRRSADVGHADSAGFEKQWRLQPAQQKHEAIERSDEKPATAVSQPQSKMGRMVDGLSTWLDEPRDIPRVATGVEQRAARLKGLGNAIVPQIAMQIGLTIKAVENG